MWISSNLTSTRNLKFRNKNNICLYIGNSVQVEFRQRISIQRRKIKIMKYKIHRCKIQKMKNKWKILWSTQYWFLIYKWLTSLWVSQPHFGLSVRVKPTLPKVGTWSPPGLPKTQSSSWRAKTPCIGVFLVSLERSWSVDV
jgi:hypothetical protein